MATRWQMQALSSVDGLLYTWTSASPDRSGAGFTGPGAPLDVVVYAAPTGTPTPTAMIVTVASHSPGVHVTAGLVIITGTISVPGTVDVAVGDSSGPAIVSGLTWSYAWTATKHEAGARTINVLATPASGVATATASVPVVVYYLGQVTTRATWPAKKSAPNSTWIVRKAFRARENISQGRLAWPNCWGGTETPSGGTLTITASVEYPAGTFTQVTFGGSTVGTESAGNILWSDDITLAVQIPDGAIGFVRYYMHGTNGICYNDTGDALNAAMGDALNITTASDLTMGGTIVNESGGVSTPFCAFVALTSKRTLAIFGDSRSAGVLDVPDASGDLGEIARALGNYGYMCSATSGQALSMIISSHANRVALAQFTNTIVINHAINDIQGSADAATCQSRLTTVANYFPTHEVWAATITPWTQGAWTNADGSDQTLPGDATHGAAARVAYNNWIRTVPAPLHGYLELARQLELTTNEAKWRADGTASKYTPDGLHANVFGNHAITLSLP